MTILVTLVWQENSKFLKKSPQLITFQIPISHVHNKFFSCCYYYKHTFITHCLTHMDWNNTQNFTIKFSFRKFITELRHTKPAQISNNTQKNFLLSSLLYFCMIFLFHSFWIDSTWNITEKTAYFTHVCGATMHKQKQNCNINSCAALPH